MIHTLHLGILLTLLMFLFGATAPALADRDDNRSRRREYNRGHGWQDRRHDDRHRPVQRTVVVRPNVVTIWPGYHSSYHSFYRAAPHYYGPQEVSMTCRGGKEVTIRASGLSLDHMLDKANQFCLSQAGGNTYRIDLLSGNRYCREYQASATIGGQAERTYGTACLQPGGSWQIVK